MRKYYNISGYWKNDKIKFDEYLVTNFDDSGDVDDELIFFYGLSEDNIKEAIELKEDTIHDFVITSYSENDSLI